MESLSSDIKISSNCSFPQYASALIEQKPSALTKTALKQQEADTNIDRHHRQQMMAHHNAIHVRIPQLRKEYAYLRNQCLQESNDTASISVNHHVRINRMAKMRDIREEIAKIKYDHNQYKLAATKSVFRYYEDKQAISSGKNKPNQTSVLLFFNLIPTDHEETITTNHETRRLIQKYWRDTEGKIVHMDDFHVDTTTCMSCNVGEMIPQEDEGTLLCNNPKCGKFIPHIIDNQKTSHTDIPAEICYTAYIRLNHFKEILSQFQAKQSTVIPQEIIDAISTRMKKERLTKEDICYSQMRETLTVLDLSKYFEHIQHINAIFGVKPPVMDAELYDTMCVLFIEIQDPWAACCPPDRRNFFNYTYVLYQLFFLLDQTQFLKYTSVAADRVMKDRVKQMEQDNTWKNVCKMLDWVYNPTV